jgi:hypothetical protein
MNCQGNVNSTLPTQLPHKFSYIVAILGHNHFESPNICAMLSHYQNAAAASREYAERFPERHHPGPRHLLI